MFDEIFSFYGGFQVICFTCLVVVLKKLIKKYVNPLLHRDVLDKIKQSKQLVHEKKHLEKIYKEYEQKTEEKSTHAQSLLKKVRVWHEVVGKKLQDHEQQRFESQERVKEYLQKQSELLSIDHAKLEIVPAALNEVALEVQQKFSSKKEQEIFLDKIIEKFTKDVACK